MTGRDFRSGKPLCKPRPGDDRTAGQRRADALTDICHHLLACGGLPDNGGDRPQLTVTVNYHTLTGQLGAAGLDTGGRLTPTQVRQLAHQAALRSGARRHVRVPQPRRFRFYGATFAEPPADAPPPVKELYALLWARRARRSPAT